MHVYSHEADLYCSLGREKFDDLIRGAEMAQSNPQIPWTDEQWARVNQVIQEEAHRARIAATFLPLYGPLPANADFVRTENVFYRSAENCRQEYDPVGDAAAQRAVRGEQLADPEMTSVLALFRRAANVIARLEDALVFNGFRRIRPGRPRKCGFRICPTAAPNVGEQIWGGKAAGLLIEPNSTGAPTTNPTPQNIEVYNDGNDVVVQGSPAIGDLEGKRPLRAIRGGAFARFVLDSADARPRCEYPSPATVTSDRHPYRRIE